MKKFFPLFRFPLVLPGDVLAGFLLVGGTALNPALLLAIPALILAEIAANTGYMQVYLKEEPPVSVRFILGLCTLTALLALVFAVFSSVWTFLAVCLLFFLRIYAAKFRTETSALLRIALGVLLVPAPHLPGLLCAATWTAGVLLYLTGQRLAVTDTAPVAARPGRRLFFAGAVIAYGTLFGIVIQKPTEDVFSLICGGLSAVSAGVFLVLAYWAFRLFQYPVTLAQTAGTGTLMSLGLIFLQAGTAAAQSELNSAVLLLLLALCLVVIRKKRKGKIDGRLD